MRKLLTLSMIGASIALSACGTLNPNSDKKMEIDYVPKIKAVHISEQQWERFLNECAEKHLRIRPGAFLTADPDFYVNRVLKQDKMCKWTEYKYSCEDDLQFLIDHHRVARITGMIPQPAVLIRSWKYNKDIVYVKAIVNPYEHYISYGYTLRSNLIK